MTRTSTLRSRWRLNDRKLEVLDAVLRYRALTAKQIQLLLYTPGGRTGCHNDLQLLATERYLSTLPRATLDPAVYLFNRFSIRGNRLMRARSGDEAFTNRLTALGPLQHLLSINELRVRLERACRELDWSLGWHPSEQLQELIGLVGLLPDGYFRIRRTTPDGVRTAGFFLELERKDKSSRIVRSKLERYLDLHLRHHDFYAERFGTQSLRILIVFDAFDEKSAARRIQAGMRDAERIGLNRVRFCSLRQIQGLQPRDCLLGPIWQAAGQKGLIELFPAKPLAELDLASA